MCVRGAHAVECRTRAHAAGDSLVVRKLKPRSRIYSANCQVIHRTLAGCGNSIRERPGQGFENRVNYSLRGFDVASSHRCRVPGIHDRALRRDYFDWFHQARAGWNVSAHQTTKHIRDRRDRDSLDGIQCAGHLWRAAGEINTRAIVFNGNAHANRNFFVADPIIVERVLSRVTTIRNGDNRATHHAGRVRDQVFSILTRFLRPPPFDNLQQTRGAGFERADLSFKICLPLFAAAYVRQDQLHHVDADFSTAHNMDRWNPHTFTVNVRGQPHRTRRGATDVGVMRAVADIEKTVGSRQWAVGRRLSFSCCLLPFAFCLLSEDT